MFRMVHLITIVIPITKYQLWVSFESYIMGLITSPSLCRLGNMK